MEKDSFFKLFLWDRDMKVVNVNSWMDFEDSLALGWSRFSCFLKWCALYILHVY